MFLHFNGRGGVYEAGQKLSGSVQSPTGTQRGEREGGGGGSDGDSG